MTHDSIDRRSVIAMLGGAAFAASHGSRALDHSTPATIPLERLQDVATGLERPESVVVDRNGRVFVSNAKSACAVVEPDGTVRHVGAPTHANGIAMDAAGRIVIASFGLIAKVDGPLRRLDLASGALTTLVDAIDGRALVASNFPVVASDGSIYCTHSTWGPDASAGIDRAVSDGFVYRLDPQGRVSILAAGLAGANGLCFDEGERHLYVALTSAGRIARMPRLSDGSYGTPEPWGPVLGEIPVGLKAADIYQRMSPAERSRLGHPDGIGFDAEGRLWVTLPFANRVIVVTEGGAPQVVIDDPDGRVIDMPTNLAWGGRDLREFHVVSRRKGTVVRTSSAVAGLPLVHQR